jgi:hypothetical protein
MQHVFGDHIRRIVEAYVDDIVVKTRMADDLINLLMTFVWHSTTCEKTG